MFDAEDLNSQLFLTRVLQALANADTRRIVETLAGRPCGCAEILQIMDSSEKRIPEVMKILQTVGLVTEREAPDGKVYLLSTVGLDHARSWLERVYSTLGAEAA